MVEIKIGADPELFVRSKKSGKIRSAHTFLTGTKEKKENFKYFDIHADGLAIEFNVVPSVQRTTWEYSIASAIKHIVDIIPSDLELCYESTVAISKGYLATLPDKVKELGCDPDYNAYTGKLNPSPITDPDNPIRTGAGHVHIGWGEGFDIKDPIFFEDCCTIVKALDQTLGLASLLYDKDTQRRSLYGKAGAFRPKPYGLEYRVLSNQWLKSPSRSNWVWATARQTVSCLFDGSFNYRFHEEIPEHINGSIVNRRLSSSYMADIGGRLPNVSL